MNKRGERSSQSYDDSNGSSYGSCYHSFCMRGSGVWNWGCVLPNWWRYGVWYVVVGYEWMIRTASCRINHTLVQDDAAFFSPPVRDTACDTAWILWFNELWPNQGQTIPRIIPRLPLCSKIWRMILGRMHALKCKKSVVNHFKNLIEAMVMKEKRLPQITLSLFD